ALGCDFLVITGHKLYGPTGTGALWAREELLKAMPPFLGGGDMINEVFPDRFTPAALPNKFEAGTPHIAGAIGLGAALDYITGIGWPTIQKIEDELTAYALKKLKSLDFVKLIGPQGLTGRGPVFSFTMKNVHPHDIAEGLSQKNICIRAGHHCNQILMARLLVPGTARISLAFYNTKEEVDRCIEALVEINEYFK
ncbi:MAG: aminotransferase class V-fold PLP-dependent enzyme, partial [Candidatus Peregrinibacteria bacterium]